MFVMNNDKKDTVNEPAAVYNIEPKTEVNQEELHPVLLQLIEKSILQANAGDLIPHEEVKRRFREKFYGRK